VQMHARKYYIKNQRKFIRKIFIERNSLLVVQKFNDYKKINLNIQHLYFSKSTKYMYMNMTVKLKAFKEKML